MKYSILAVFILLLSMASFEQHFLYFRYRKSHPNRAKIALKSAMIGVPIAIPGGYIMNNFILN